MTLDYKVMEGSLYNTPPCWSIYVCGLVFKHLLAAGGLKGVKANNDAKAKLVWSPFLHSSSLAREAHSTLRTVRVAQRLIQLCCHQTCPTYLKSSPR